jgi:hypothetical protein
VTRSNDDAPRTRTGDAPRTGGPVEPAGDPVPRLPRGRGLRLSRPELVRVVGLAALLVFLIVIQRPCANAVSRFVTGFGDQGSAAAAMPRPGTIDLPASAASAGSAAGSGAAGAAPGASDDLDRYEHLRPGMTDAEVKAVIDRARAKTGTASGSAR